MHMQLAHLISEADEGYGIYDVWDTSATRPASVTTQQESVTQEGFQLSHENGRRVALGYEEAHIPPFSLLVFHWYMVGQREGRKGACPLIIKGLLPT